MINIFIPHSVLNLTKDSTVTDPFLSSFRFFSPTVKFTWKFILILKRDTFFCNTHHVNTNLPLFCKTLCTFTLYFNTSDKPLVFLIWNRRTSDTHSSRDIILSPFITCLSISYCYRPSLFKPPFFCSFFLVPLTDHEKIYPTGLFKRLFTYNLASGLNTYPQHPSYPKGPSPVSFSFPAFRPHTNRTLSKKLLRSHRRRLTRSSTYSPYSRFSRNVSSNSSGGLWDRISLI